MILCCSFTSEAFVHPCEWCSHSSKQCAFTGADFRWLLPAQPSPAPLPPLPGAAATHPWLRTAAQTEPPVRPQPRRSRSLLFRPSLWGAGAAAGSRRVPASRRRGAGAVGGAGGRGSLTVNILPIWTAALGGRKGRGRHLVCLSERLREEERSGYRVRPRQAPRQSSPAPGQGKQATLAALATAGRLGSLLLSGEAWREPAAAWLSGRCRPTRARRAASGAGCSRTGSSADPSWCARVRGNGRWGPVRPVGGEALSGHPWRSAEWLGCSAGAGRSRALSAAWRRHGHSPAGERSVCCRGGGRGGGCAPWCRRPVNPERSHAQKGSDLLHRRAGSWGSWGSSVGSCGRNSVTDP